MYLTITQRRTLGQKTFKNKARRQPGFKYRLTTKQLLTLKQNNKVMTQESKIKIAEALKERIQTKGLSQDAAGRSIGNLSGSMINQIINKKFLERDNVVSQETWNKISVWLGINDDWKIVKDLECVNKIRTIAHYCKKVSKSKILIGPPGRSKSQTLKKIAQTVNDVYYVECAEYFTKKVFLQKLCQNLGINSGVSIPEMMESIFEFLNKASEPLIIIDEADKLKDGVLALFNPLYNASLSRCGFVLSGSEYLRQRIKKGVEKNKQSYCEIYSRVGKEFIDVPVIGREDVKKICIANGIMAEEDIQRVYNTSLNDLRVVRNSIENLKLEIEGNKKKQLSLA